MQRTESWRPLFVGRRDGTSVQFVCFNSGGFAIVLCEQVMQLGQSVSLENALDRFLGMIDRPTPRLERLETPSALDRRLMCA